MRYIKIIILISALFPLSHLALLGQGRDTITIGSQVTGLEGSPIFNATIIGNNGKTIKRSGSSGNFTIEVPDNSEIYVSAEGYLTKTIMVQQNLGPIILDPDTLGKSVNIGFRKIAEMDKHGGITVIQPDEYSKYDYEPFVSQGVSGRFNTWGMGMLLLIDGIPRDYDDLRLDEIEQISILKGVNAVAIYGSYAANGVILITTKRGKANERRINVRANYGINIPKSFPNYLNSADYMTAYNEARRNDGLEDLYTEETIENHSSGNIYQFPDIDYYSDEYLKNFVTENDVSLDFSTGNDNAQFYTNIGWFSNTSLVDIGEGENEGYKRFNVRGNIDLKINDFISGSLDVSTIIRNARSSRANYWAQADTLLPNKYTPLLPVDMISVDSVRTMADNSRNIIDNKYILGGNQEYLTNPFAELYVGGYNMDISRNLQMTNTINFNLGKVIEGLSFHSKISADYYNTYTQSIDNNYAVYSPTWGTDDQVNQIVNLSRLGVDQFPGTQNIEQTRQTRYLGMSLYFKYHKNISDLHNISAFLIGTGSSISYTGTYQPEISTNLGLQLTYNYRHRYWIDFSGALLNSVKLPDNNRSALSPTVSLAWLLSEEDFLSGSSAIDRLKWSVSAGIINTDTYIDDYYLYDNTYALDGYYGYNEKYSNQELISLQGANPDLTFVKRKEVNTSIEGSFFKKLLEVQASFFMTTLDGGLTKLSTQYPSYYYDFVPLSNFNSELRTGVDLMLNLNKEIGEVLLTIGVNVLYVTSEILKRDEIYTDDYLYREGKPVDVIYGLENDGLFEDDADIEQHPLQVFGEVQPGDIKYVDQNDDGKINENDQVEIGRWGSPLSYAIHFSASFHDLTLYARGLGANGGYGMKNNNYFWVDGDDKYSEVVNDRWMEGEDNSSATFPRLSSQTSTNNYRYSDYWLYKTDRFILDKIQLTYGIPMKNMPKRFIGGIDIYVSGNNLLTVSENKEIMELSVYGSPTMRYYKAGIKASF